MRAFLAVLYTSSRLPVVVMPLPSLVHVPLPLPLQQLKEMFPQMDEEVFRSVLEANRGNVELSINQLLTMS